MSFSELFSEFGSKLLKVKMSPPMCLCATLHYTLFIPWRQLARRPAHVDKGVEVSLQTLIRLPLQSSQRPELGPVEGFPLWVIHHPK